MEYQRVPDNNLRHSRRIVVLATFVLSLVPTDLQAQQARAWQINASDNVDILFVDPSGRRAGRDPRVSVGDGYIEEIPGVHYSTFSAGDLEESAQNDDTRELLIDPGVPRPAGEYRIDVIGRTGGTFWCDFALMFRGLPMFKQLRSGLIVKDSVRTFRLLYTPTEAIPLSVSPIVTPADIALDISAAESGGMIKTKGLATSLQQKAGNASKAAARGNTKAAVNTLEALINEAKAQRGEGIAPEAADAIVADCDVLIAQWRGEP